MLLHSTRRATVPRVRRQHNAKRFERILTRRAAESCGLHAYWHVCIRSMSQEGLAEPTEAAGGRGQDEERPMADLGFLASFLGELL